MALAASLSLLSLVGFLSSQGLPPISRSECFDSEKQLHNTLPHSFRSPSVPDTPLSPSSLFLKPWRFIQMCEHSLPFMAEL